MTESVWNGYKRIDFEFEGMSATLVFPNEANSEGNWLLKTEYFDAFPEFELEMLSRGWHLAYVANVTRWCLDEDVDRKARFIKYLAQEYSLADYCMPVGMSCGGLIAAKLAVRYPECVSAMYLDAPVLNLLSCPAGIGKASDHMYDEFYRATGISLSELICYRDHPIDHMSELLENNIPILIVYGDSDSIVPYCENGAVLEKYYREHSGVIFTYGKKGCDHHPHGLEDNTPIVEFAEKYGKGRGKVKNA